MKGIHYKENFLSKPSELYFSLKEQVDWDDRMATRMTASFGKAYNYSQIQYPYKEFTSELQLIIKLIHDAIGFAPNNCLLNYYLDGNSKMGFHSDQTDVLVEGTGVAIVSLGETRTLRFRYIKNKNMIQDYPLHSGSMIYMSNELQEDWQHSIPKSDTEKGRMSLTFRKIK